MRLGAAALVAATGVRIASLVLPIFNPDEATIAVQAQTLAAGGRLYVDIADRKPPLVPYLYAGLFALTGTDDLRWPRAAAILVVAATALVLAQVAARRAGPRAGLWALGLFIAASVCGPPSETLAANFELFMLLPTACAMALVGRGAPWREIGTGLLLGLATLCKQTAAVALLPALFVCARTEARGLRILALLAGFGATLGSCLLWLGQPFLFWTFTGNAGYLAPQGIVGYALYRGLGMTLLFVACNGILCWLAARSAPSHLRRDADLWVWLASSFVGVAAGLRFFGHYYLQLLPPLVLLAAPEAAALAPRLQRLLAASVGTAALGFGIAGFWNATLCAQPEYREVAAYVSAHTLPTDRIAVWGHFPELYWAARRRPGSRLPHTDFLVGTSGGRPSDFSSEAAATPGAWSAFLGDLTASCPTLFIDTSPAKVRDYDHHPLTHYPALDQFVAAHYRPMAEVQGHRILLRSRGCAETPIAAHPASVR